MNKQYDNHPVWKFFFGGHGGIQLMNLLENGRVNQAHIAEDGNTEDFKPVVKIFGGACTWLLTEISPEDWDAGRPVAFGLCDLGMGFPELGYVDLLELAQIDIPMTLIDDMTGHKFTLRIPLEIDVHFVPKGTLSWYAERAREQQRLVA